MFFVIFPVLALLAAMIHLIAASKRNAGWTVIASIFLRYILLINVGLEGIFAFYGHAFMADQIAESIGWAPSPFQYEVAIANLAVGTLGVLCFWFGGTFWFATIVATTVWLWGDAVGHIRQIIINHNYAPNNAGPALYDDLVLPAVLIILAIGARVSVRRT
ncbi:MAG: DUF6790 family protein [Candidatus Binataceae bacterium]